MTKLLKFFFPAHLYAGSRDSLSIRVGRKTVVGEYVKRLFMFLELLRFVVDIDFLRLGMDLKGMEPQI